MFGQEIMAEHYHQSTRAMKEKDLTEFLSTQRANISPTSESSRICESVLQSGPDFIDR
jgi:hypothetical protein